VQDFWASLPDDAGVWREVVTVSAGRFMHASSQTEKTGLAKMARLRESSNEGYWGVYRNRLSESKTDAFTSPFMTSASPSQASVVQKPIISLSDPTGNAKPIRQGRVYLPTGIDNLCFVREYQDYGSMSEAESKLWSERIAPHAKAWIDYLDKERRKNGILSFRTSVGVDFESADPADTTTTSDISNWQGKTTSKRDQLGYFLDLEHFERAGKSYREHHKARGTYMKLYGPGGEVGAGGKVHLMVELCILKKDDLEAEYVGCVEGTGLMLLEGMAGYRDEE
jgi:hypothetical protein